ncbi:hypothetical protein N018_01995 [Pseudomonas syringae CC1557]|uniref:Uncharacterized protein n=1 Tax=Pseudomonas syringae CC1557 TaxID=1357279 RepID=W0N365_PSESX|nr:hypothetical protein N018_01995 [Pseudomonas syringae CC1557]
MVEAHVGFLYQNWRMRQCTLAYLIRQCLICD